MVTDFLLSIIITLLDNTVNRFLPVEIPAFPLSDFQAGFLGITSTFAEAFNTAQIFINIELIFRLLGVILLAEFVLHFGFKSIKYLIGLIRGSGT